MVALFSTFYNKIWVGFCLNTGKCFFLEVSFYSKQKKHRYFYKTVLLFEKSACFYVTISAHFERFQYFYFKTDFLENENLLQKTAVLFFR